MKMLLILICFVFISTHALAQLNPQPNKNNPVVPKGQNGEWDDSALWWPNVTVVDGTFYMCFNATGDWPSQPASIGIATSHNGYIFTKSASNPIMAADGNGFDAYGTTGGLLYFNDGTWYLYYSGRSTTLNQPGNVIGRATATNPHGPWTRSNDTLLTVGSNGAWDDEFISPQSILPTDTGLVMYYWAGNSWTGMGRKPQIGMATSTDGGLSWHKYDDPSTTTAPYAESDPVLAAGAAGNYDGAGIWGCSILKSDSKWEMLYTGDSGNLMSICYATSGDGITWDKHTANPLFIPSQDPASTINFLQGVTTVFWDNKYFIYYDYGVTVNGIGMATSSRYLSVPADYSTIQGAIDAALDGDVVLVDEGTYFENINYKGKAITVASNFILDQDTSHISKTIIDGSRPDDPNKGSVVTFNSGEDTTSVLCGFTITGGTGTVRSSSTIGGGIYTYNSGALISNNIIKHNVIYSQNYSSFGGGIVCWSDTMDRKFVRISENIITYNQALSDYKYGGYGGAIDVFGSDVCIENNVISYNQVSGGSYCYGPGVRLVYTTEGTVLKNNIFSNNSFLNGDCHAGGLFLVITRDVKILDNHFEGNTGSWGAGLYDYSSKNTLISNNVFFSDTAEYSGGGIIVQQCTNSEILQNDFMENSSDGGGGIYMYQTDRITIQENRFVGNESGYGGGILEYNCTNSNFIQNEIKGNIATVWGGGMHNFQNVNTLIAENTIVGNSASSGAGILVDEQHAVVVKNLIADNTADSLGGGIIIYYDSSNTKGRSKTHFNDRTFYQAGYAGCIGEETPQRQLEFSRTKIAATDNQTILINNTICNNTATIGGGGIYNEDENTKIINTILWGNSAASNNNIMNDSGTVVVSYSDIQDSVWQGVGTIYSDPLFSDTLYHLDIGSPCIDTGHPRLIYNDEDGTQNDMGAYGGVTDSLLATVTGFIETDSKQTIPTKFVLSQNYPNPFNPVTTIEYQIPGSQFVELSIYNILGQKVATLVNKRQSAGTYYLKWNASGYSSGVYIYRLKTDKGFIQSRKLILMK